MATLYSPRIVTDGLILAFDAANPKSFSGVGTTCYDLSGTGYNGTINNGPAYSASYGGEFAFNGSSSYISVNPVLNFATPNQLTAIVWARSFSANWNENGFLASKRDQFIIHPASGSQNVGYYVNTVGNGWQNVSVAIPNITAYNQYCLTYNSGSTITYLNGVQKSTSGFGSSLSSDTGELTIGRDEGFARYFSGSIALAQFYSRALTANEIMQNYMATKGRFGL